jgi:hypothetical protein
MVESLWSIPNTESLRAPLAILREQATALTEQTRGTLIGVAESLGRQASNIAIGKEAMNAFTTGPGSAVLGQQGGELNFGLSIQVPALNDYKYRLLTYRQPVTMYPGTLSFPLKNLDYAIINEEQFLAALKGILSSPEVQNLLASLLAQATDS